jgi:LPXTG-motif cell wall-anchored protein
MTVVELPETGAGDVIVSLLGLGSLTAVIGAYLASRRAQLGA